MLQKITCKQSLLRFFFVIGDATTLLLFIAYCLVTNLMRRLLLIRFFRGLNTTPINILTFSVHVLKGSYLHKPGAVLYRGSSARYIFLYTIDAFFSFVQRLF